MLRKSILLCAMLLAIHATAGADQDNPPAEGEAAAKPAKPERLCVKSEKLELVAGQLADLQHIPPSPELILKAREAGVDANPVYAKFGVTGEFDSFKKWLEDLKETADARRTRARRKESSSRRGRRRFPRSVLGGAGRPGLFATHLG
jgi:hypothetical protein